MLDDLPFLEMHRDQLAVDAAFHHHGIERRHRAQAAEEHRHVAATRRNGHHGHGAIGSAFGLRRGGLLFFLLRSLPVMKRTISGSGEQQEPKPREAATPGVAAEFPGLVRLSHGVRPVRGNKGVWEITNRIDSLHLATFHLEEAWE